MSASTSENKVTSHFFLNYKHILIDEIALEGLEGITLDLLWKRVELRINATLTEKMKARIWNIVLNSKDIFMYQLPEPLQPLIIHDRFYYVDIESGELKDPEDYLDGPYEFCPVLNEYGSSKYYMTRQFIPSFDLHNIPFEKIIAGYGNTLVLVASLEQRWHALANHLPITCIQQLMPIQYCILELIGKSRENGQMTIGKSNLAKIVKEPKNLFYNRNLLQNYNLIKALRCNQFINQRLVRSLLLRLNRFHKPSLMSLPKTGRIFKTVEYLRTCPQYAAKTDDLLNLGLYDRTQTKKIRKNYTVFNFVEMDYKEPPKKKQKRSQISTPQSLLKKRYVTIQSKSDESSQSEDETPTEPVKNQYKIGISLMRQAYERLLEAGKKGISQIELGDMLGIEFYVSRTICKVLKSKKIVREFYEDKGKQRISRYVAVATGHDDANYVHEKNKFLEYMAEKNQDKNMQNSGTSELIIPDILEPEPDKLDEHESTHITEVSCTSEHKIKVKSLLESRKSLTLRQLKFGNGVIQIVKEKLCVTGYQTLSNLVAKAINEPPMVTKALKMFLQKLVAAGQIKIFHIKWPGAGNDFQCVNLICAPHIKATNPIVRSKFKEVQVRATSKKVAIKKSTCEENVRPLATFVNPRYMKIQRLHEAIIKLAHFETPIEEPTLPAGFLSMTDLLPEMTVKFAISNMSITGLSEIAHLRILDHHHAMKLKDAPTEIAHPIIKCKSLRNAMRLNLKALAMYGLIQLIYQPDVQTVDYTNSTLVSFVFYVNRNASIVNTTGQWPRNVDPTTLERHYYFDTFDDVKNYWNDVYEISIETKITLEKKRAKKTLSPPIRRQGDILLYDNGHRYGDGDGPCGQDSCFFMEIPRFWRSFYIRNKAIIKKKPPPLKIPKLSKVKPKRVREKKKPPPKPKPVSKEKKSRKRLSEMPVTWKPEDDYVVMLAQAALTIASPSSQPGCLRLRNIVATEILNLRDEWKTPSVCHRRAMLLQMNANLMHEKEKLLNEMRRRRYLIVKYEGLIKKLRLRNSTNMSRYMNEAKLPLMELMWLIWRVSRSKSYNKTLACVAYSVDEFHRNFSIVPATASKMYNMYKSPEHAILRESVFLTVMLSWSNEVKSEPAKKIYAIFKTYPENSLRVVIDQLRRSGAISAKEKVLNNQMHRLHLEDIVQCAYKVSANYRRRWIGRLNSDYALLLADAVETELPDNIKGSAEINCVLCEAQGVGLIDILTAEEPVIVNNSGDPTMKDEISVGDIELKHKLKSGTVTWRPNPEHSDQWDVKTFASFYKDTEYESYLKRMAKSSVVYFEEEHDIKFNMQDVIISHLLRKGKDGSTFVELQENTGYETAHLMQSLSQLESDNIIKRVGLVDNVIILIKYIKHWSLRLDHRYLIATPWLTFDFNIRYNVLLEWAGVILNRIFEFPGSSLTSLSDAFELITGRAVQDICMFLEHTECIYLKTVKYKQADLFSEDDDVPEEYDCNQYESIENIFAFPVKNAITRYAHLRKCMLDEYYSDSTT